MMRRSKGFTLIELLVVIAIIALLISILVPSLTRARALAYQAKCMANVKGIGNSMAVFLAENNDQYPMISNISGMSYNADMIAGGKDDVYDLDNVADGFGTSLNINENLCLLVAKAGVPWKMFRCPSVSSDVMVRAGSNKKFGFKDADYASNKTIYYDYAYHLGYSNPGSSNAASFSAVGTSSDFVIYGDQPGDSLREFDLQASGSEGAGYNHGANGVALLCAGGNAKFSKDSILAGCNDNNVYSKDMTAASDSPNGGTGVSVPDNKRDSVLIEVK